MTNREFANLLAVSVKIGKLKESNEVNDFIEKYQGDPEAKIIKRIGKPTADQRSIIELIRKDSKDNELNYIFDQILPPTQKKESKKIEANGRFKGQEW